MQISIKENRILQYLIIILILAGVAGGYFYYQSKASNVIKQADQTGLVGYWPFEEGTGTTTADRSGNGNTGTLNNMDSADWVAGKVGKGLDFDGSNDRVVVSDSDSISVTGALSISFWMKANSLSGTPLLIDKYTGERSYKIQVQATWCQPNELAFSVSSDGATFVGGVFCSNPVLTTGTWQHITLTFTPSSSVKFYVNGVDQSRAWGYGSIPAAIYNSVKDLYIGSDTTGAYNFNGQIDEVRIYNRAIIATEVATNYNSGLEKINASQTSKLTSGLVGYWTFDGGDMNATQALDKSPVGTNTGTLTGTTRAIGKIGQSLTFNGTSDYVGTTNLTGFTNSTPFSFSAWIKTTDTNRATILGNYIAGNATNFEVNAAGRLRIYLNDGTNVKDYTSSSGGTVNTSGDWVHAVATYDGAQNPKLYINGSSVSLTKTTDQVLNGSLDSGSPMRIGVDNRGTPGTTWFAGSIDEVRIYNRALSTSEITELYNQGKEKINASQSTKLTSGLAGYWTMDGNDTTWTSATDGTVTDKSGNGNTGTLINMNRATAPVPGKIGQALRMRQNLAVDNSESLSVGSAATLDDLSAVTISAWVYPLATSTGTIYDARLCDYSAGYRFNIAANEALTFYAKHSTTGLTVTTNNSTLTLNQWQHVAIAWDGSTSASNAKLYINGSEVGYQTQTNGVGTRLSDGASTKRIGITSSCDANSFKGSIDEVRIYNRALSTSEITELYNMGR